MSDLGSPLTDVVMLKKTSGKWRMCVDFTNLSLACPKNLYCLQSIDRLINDALG